MVFLHVKVDTVVFHANLNVFTMLNQTNKVSLIHWYCHTGASVVLFYVFLRLMPGPFSHFYLNSTLISILVTDYIHTGRGQALFFSFEYNLLSNFNNVLSAPIFLECRSAPAPLSKKGVALPYRSLRKKGVALPYRSFITLFL